MSSLVSRIIDVARRKPEGALNEINVEKLIEELTEEQKNVYDRLFNEVFLKTLNTYDPTLKLVPESRETQPQEKQSERKTSEAEELFQDRKLSNVELQRKIRSHVAALAGYKIRSEYDLIALIDHLDFFNRNGVEHRMLKLLPQLLEKARGNHEKILKAINIEELTEKEKRVLHRVYSEVLFVLPSTSSSEQKLETGKEKTELKEKQKEERLQERENGNSSLQAEIARRVAALEGFEITCKFDTVVLVDHLDFLKRKRVEHEKLRLLPGLFKIVRRDPKKIFERINIEELTEEQVRILYRVYNEVVLSPPVTNDPNQKFTAEELKILLEEEKQREKAKEEEAINVEKLCVMQSFV